MSVTRDPETGQFKSADDAQFDRLEKVAFSNTLSVPAADVDGSTGQLLGQEGVAEGIPVADYAKVLDRDEAGAILDCYHRIVVYISSTQTADGTLNGFLEFSFSGDESPILRSVDNRHGDVDDASGAFNIERDDAREDDTVDVVGPVLRATAHGPITDGTNGVGGAGSAGWDEWMGEPVEPDIDARDELLANVRMEHANVSDAALHLDYVGYHVVGVDEEAFRR